MKSNQNLVARLNATSPLTPLIITAIASGLIYLTVFTLPFPLTQFYVTIPPVDYTKLTGYSRGGFLIYVFGIAVLFGLYIWSIRTAILQVTLTPDTAPNRQRSPARLVFFSGGIFAVILLFSYPLTAIDLFIYAIRTRGWALYDLPPISTPPEALPVSDPWIGLAGPEWVDAASPYGPLWEWFSLAAFSLSGGAYLNHLLALKLIGAISYLGSAWLVYHILRQVQPRWALAGTIAFAWNPLVLFESVQNAHNDMLMILFLLAAIWTFEQIMRQMGEQVQTSHPLRIGLLALFFCFLLAMSVLIKFVTVLMIPFFLLTLAIPQPSWLKRLATLTVFGFATAGFIVLPMLPVWPGWENWAVAEAGSGAGRSLLALLVLSLRAGVSTNAAFDISRLIITAIFGIIYLYCLWRVINRTRSLTTASMSPAQMLSIPIWSSFYTFFWYVLLAAPVFHAWYLLWFLPLASLLLPRQRPLLASIVFSITALLIIPYFETVRIWYPILLQNQLLGHAVGVPLLIIAPILALLWPTNQAILAEG